MVKLTLGGVLSIAKDLFTTVLRKKYELKPRYSDAVHKLYTEVDDEVHLPVTAVEHFFELEMEDVRVKGRSIPVGKSLFIPREGQEEAVATVHLKLRDKESRDAGLLVAGCGKGKTIMGTEVARRMGVSTCIVVHKEHLGDQWVAAIKLLAPEASIGFVRQARCDSGEEFDFVIASTQSLASKTRVYSPEFYRSFGLVLFDEVHRYGADTWQIVMGKFLAKWKLGLTATAKRFDGLWGVITANLGEALFTLDSDPITFKVFAVSFKTDIPREAFDFEWLDAKMKRAKLLTLLANHPGRNKQLAKNVFQSFEAGRRVIFVSDRKAQLKMVIDFCKDLGVPDNAMGLFIGGLSKKQKEEAKSRQFVFTTYQMSEEGLDIEELNVLFIGTPRSHITQLVGRIMREFEGQKTPAVFDPVDLKLSETMGWFYSRQREYVELGAEILGFGERKK